MQVDADLRSLFPDNPFVQRLLTKSEELNIRLAPSQVQQQWLYHPDYRTIFVWPMDLAHESLSYLIVIFAHELGHAIDFDNNPEHLQVTRNMHWSEVPDRIEEAAFVNAFILLQELQIPITLQQYCLMIEQPMAVSVKKTLLAHHLCVLRSAEPEDKTA